MDDNSIVQLYLNRDERAIKVTAEKYGAKLKDLSLHITGDIQTAEECENDTYMQTWNRIPPNEPRDFFYSFLACIIRHISLDRCREQDRLKRKATIVELTEEMEMCIPANTEVEDTIEGIELGRVISDFLSKLPQNKRIIFVRRYFFLDSIIDISRRCGVSESNVKMTLLRTRNRLRDYLIQEGYTI